MDIWTGHGGRTDKARKVFPDASMPWLDLSTGINPRPWTGVDLSGIDLSALPGPIRLAELEAAAAATFGTTAERIASVPGSEIGLRLLGALELPAPFRYVLPAYVTHAGIAPGSLPITPDMLEREAGRGGTIVLANPNNPDGRALAPERLLAIAASLRENEGWLVVDEAFVDAQPDLSVVPRLIDDDRVIVLRSFGKFFGLAGLRLGFAVAPAGQIAQVRRRLGSWPVSSPAIDIGLAAYRDTAWIERTRADLVDRSATLDAMLARHDLIARGACPLFRLVETPDAHLLFQRLARAGILTRPFDYAPTWLRIGLPRDEADLDRLDRALADG